MSNLYKMYETDTNFETNGVDLEIAEGVRFRVARSGGQNKKYQQILQKLMKPYQRQFEQGTLDNERAGDIMQLAFIRGCLLGWEGVDGRDGQPMEFNEGNALKLFGDLPDLFAQLQEQAGKVSNYRQEDIEESSGNSAAS
jgi:hypothetical protein